MNLKVVQVGFLTLGFDYPQWRVSQGPQETLGVIMNGW
jgi:hypothetical protein